MKTIIVLASFILSSTLAFSSPIDGKPKCEEILVGHSAVIPSGRDTDLITPFADAVKIIFGKEGIAQKLGLALPPHQVEFVPSAQLSVLATLGRHPIGHWYDGSMIATQSYKAAGVLEFVTPGCPTCRSFYSDTTSYEHQLSVLMHVAGHNDFAAHSMYNSIRPSDPIADSLKLYDLIEDLYRNYDHDEVSQWYQYMLSLSHVQDMARGTFDSPESLAPKSSDSILERIAHTAQEFLASNPYGNKNHPKNPSPSVLQAVVTNLPEHAPAWKKEVASLFEKINRVKGYYVSTKIMNEGWATMMQELIAQHSPWQSSHYAIEHAHLLAGVAVKDLSNPYWLGRECWRNLRRIFNERSEIRDLDHLEQDRRFVSYAHELIEQLNDYDFIRLALDERWVFEQNLFLHRKAEWQEQDHTLPPPRPGTIKAPEQKVVVSRDHRRVVDYIARQLADHSLHFPRIFIDSFSAYGRNVVSLRHEIVDDIPLEPTSAAQTLYVMSRIFNRPVSLTTIFATVSGDSLAVRIEVEPNAKTLVYHKDTGALLAENNIKPLQEAVTHIHEDIIASSNQDLAESEMRNFTMNVVTQVLNHNTNGVMDLTSHSPTAARALLEYVNMVDRRMARALEHLLKQKTQPKVKNNKIRLKVLPNIPEFHFDQNAHRLLKEKKPPAPIDPTTLDFIPMMRTATETVGSNDDDVEIGGGDKQVPRPGDKFWGERKPKNGEGEGEGENEGEDGDNTGRKPGDGTVDPTEIEIPLELYGELLKDELELPNLRPKPGLDEVHEDVREGGIHRPYGNVLWARVVPRALALGDMALRKKGIDPRKVDRKILLKEGFKLIQPSDYVVSDSDPTPIPDIHAVVVIYMDMTGSMTGDPIQRAKELTFNLKALLSAKYKKLEFRYVGFNTVGTEFTEDKFFKTFLGGGTDYASGLKKTKEILETYSPAKWDRFSFGIGDSEDNGSPETASLLQEVIENTQYSAYVHTKTYEFEWDWGFLKLARSLAAQEPYFGIAEVDQRPESSMEALRKLFGKGQKLQDK